MTDADIESMQEDEITDAQITEELDLLKEEFHDLELMIPRVLTAIEQGKIDGGFYRRCFYGQLLGPDHFPGEPRRLAQKIAVKIYGDEMPIVCTPIEILLSQDFIGGSRKPELVQLHRVLTQYIQSSNSEGREVKQHA